MEESCESLIISAADGREEIKSYGST